MTDIPRDYRKKTIILKHRKESIVTDSFSSYDSDDNFFHSVKDLYFGDVPIEVISGQEVQSGSSFIHYQIPYENRGSGIVEDTFSIVYDTTSIVDDGEGNLYDETDEETIIGNIYYNSGNIILKNESPFTNFIGNDTTIEFKREVHFIENKLYIDVNKGEYNKSSNETFNSSEAPHPFISCIYLYNDDNELIAKAQFSKPISTEVDTFIVLDDLETV